MIFLYNEDEKLNIKRINNENLKFIDDKYEKFDSEIYKNGPPLYTIEIF